MPQPTTTTSVSIPAYLLLEFPFEYLLVTFVRFELRVDDEVALRARHARPALGADAPVPALELPRPSHLRRGGERLVLDHAVALLRARFGDEIDFVVAVAPARVGHFDDRLAFAEVGRDRAV